MLEFWKCVVITLITSTFWSQIFFHVFPDCLSSKPQTEPCYKSVLVSKTNLCWLLYLITHNATIHMHVWFWHKPFNWQFLVLRQLFSPHFTIICYLLFWLKFIRSLSHFSISITDAWQSQSRYFLCRTRSYSASDPVIFDSQKRQVGQFP